MQTDDFVGGYEYLVVENLRDITFSNDIVHKKNKSIKSLLIGFIPVSLKKMIRGIGYNKMTDKYLILEAQLLLNNSNESISDYLESYDTPQTLLKYINSFPKKQSLATLGTLEIITLLNIRNSHLKYGKN